MTTATERDSLVESHLIDRIERVDLRVADVDRAVAFYRDVAGFDVAEAGPQRASLRSGGGPVFLVLDSTGVTEPADPEATGLFHTAFRYPTRAALGDALARVATARLALGAADHLVSEALYVDDPDGNGVELYWDRPVEEWPPPSEDMMVPMASDPLDLDGVYAAGRGPDAVGDAAPGGTDVGHVHLQVSDVDRTVDFYRDVLGLDLTARLGRSAGFFSSKGYHHNLGANAWRSRGRGPAPKHRAGLERVVFGADDAKELDALRGRLRERGVSYTDVARGLQVLDPDGIELHFVLTDSQG